MEFFKVSFICQMIPLILAALGGDRRELLGIFFLFYHISYANRILILLIF